MGISEGIVTRDEWLKEMSNLSPSDKAFEAYVELEEFVVGHTALTATYRRNKRGQSHYATFNGSVDGHCSVSQILAGRCELIWKWKKSIRGITPDQHLAINETLDRFRLSLDGSKLKSWEQVKVLRLGKTRVKDALAVAANELVAIMRSTPTP